ncbi:tyrosine-protein kinase transmembrane receptor Ror-like isoform X2 [Diorhabda sublineata]|uniref:tyrosine-protein kinase transmembrane receptor Ror-like isoform X2 n=1 Tax=Diorhabda sublineata TaxID=1163346 RepID=UPI0024E06C42|nr:tyrosine-protein kinase transmembrane receptor Ror-like isoform X2 [Diorhabda sublineata]
MNKTVFVPVLVVLFSLASILCQEYEDDEDYEDISNINSTSNGSLTFITKLSNVTRNVGKAAKFVCEVKNLDTNHTNSKVSISWRHLVPVETNEKYKIANKHKENLYTSTLRILNLEYFDRGFVECIARNGIEKIRSVSYLEINQEPNKYGSTVINSLKTENSDLNSYGEITTFVPNSIAKDRHNDFLTTVGSKSKTFSAPIQFDLDSSGKLPENVPKPYNSSQPLCQLYVGQKCRKHLAGKFVFVQPPYSQKDIEDKLDAAFLVISQSNDISPICSKFAEPSVCFSAFPLCIDHEQIDEYHTQHFSELSSLTSDNKQKFKNIRTKLTNSLRRICRDECLLLENELCSKEYSIAKRHLVISQIMELEVCEQLPTEVDISSKHCLTLGVGELNVDREEECYWDTGKLYRGVQDKSYTSKPCLRWAHQFHISTSDNPELAGHNYCRNPKELEKEPFCYIDQNQREVCGVNKCVYVFGTYIGGSIVALIAVVAAFAYCYCNRKNKLTRNLQNDLPQVSKNIYGSPGPSAPMELNSLLPPHLPPHRSNHGSNKNSIQSVPHYTFKEVRFLEELGEGAFGKVYKGELKAKTGKMFVAVKSLKENASAKTQADFQREIELISELKHPNIICLLGVVVKQEPMCMLFEYMSEGDLHEFLISNSPEEGKCLTHNQFLDIAIQIAQGMEYLSSNHYVHRDLAARNCLVSKDLVVKISDFGLSRDMYSCDYYRVQSKSLLPVRWMPPDSILYGKFTTESDVWSYGVVLWEIYSYGLQPYYGYNNQEVINMIRSRKLLPCPDACPSYCYALMVECWAEQANRRPNFSEIVHRLKIWRQSGSTNGAYFKTAPTPQKYSQSLKSNHTSDSQSGCPGDIQMSFTWERDRHKPTSSRLNDSQSSLTSRSSSLGNTTQSTVISNEIHREKRPKKSIDSLDRLNPKNTVVSSSGNGDGVETKITL